MSDAAALVDARLLAVDLLHCLERRCARVFHWRARDDGPELLQRLSDALSASGAALQLTETFHDAVTTRAPVTTLFGGRKWAEAQASAVVECRQLLSRIEGFLVEHPDDGVRPIEDETESRLGRGSSNRRNSYRSNNAAG